MIVKQLIDEDFTNYRTCSMFIGLSKCSFKCDLDAGMPVCQNGSLAKSRGIPMSPESIADRYRRNKLSEAIVFGGLEPFDTPFDLFSGITAFRKVTQDPIIIYTGYTPDELRDLQLLRPLIGIPNIIIKHGRFIPNQKKHKDPLLGVDLASPNQRADYLENLFKKSLGREYSDRMTKNGKKKGRPRGSSKQ